MSIVAVIDTGCDTQHPLLRDRIIDGYSLLSGGMRDDSGHGTHVAGIVVQTYPDAQLLPVRVVGKITLPAMIATGIRHAADWQDSNGETVDVINLSVGVERSPAVVIEAIRYAHDKGIAVVVAAGNDGDGDVSTVEESRIAIPEVVTVGAVNRHDDIAYYSNTGPAVDISALGVMVRSAAPGGGYAVMSGTSMAAPAVSGALAMIADEWRRRYGRRATVDELKQVLYGGARKPERYRPHGHGHGVLDVSNLSYPEVVELPDNKDVSEWAKPAHAWAVVKGITDGLRPQDKVTREEIWTMLFRYEEMKRSGT